MEQPNCFKLLAELAEAERAAYDPSEDEALIENGFVFSITEIRAAIERNRRLKRGRDYAVTGLLCSQAA